MQGNILRAVMEVTAWVLGDKEEFGHELSSQAATRQPSSGAESCPLHDLLFTSSDVGLKVS